MWIADWWWWVATMPVCALSGLVFGADCALLQLKEKGLYGGESMWKLVGLSMAAVLAVFGIAIKHTNWTQWSILAAVGAFVVFQTMWRIARIKTIEIMRRRMHDKYVESTNGQATRRVR